ncbi:hypothetical protein [Acetivibrio straminisolvens]|nr:hypothetical protein [Acetivibrio straminisolvens]
MSNVKITGNVYFDGLNVSKEYDIVELKKRYYYFKKVVYRA